MTGLEEPLALFLLLNLGVALWRAARGPSMADRMLGALLFGSTGTGILLLLAHSGNGPTRTSWIDVALVLALLAAITGVAFARRAWVGSAPSAPASAPTSASSHEST